MSASGNSDEDWLIFEILCGSTTASSGKVPQPCMKPLEMRVSICGCFKFTSQGNDMHFY